MFSIGQEKIELNLVPIICSTLPPVNFSIEQLWPELKNEKLSTPFPRKAMDLDILIGLNTFLKIIKESNTLFGSIRYTHTGLAAIQSRHGYIIFGTTSAPLTSMTHKCHCIVNTVVNTDEIVEGEDDIISSPKGRLLDKLLSEYFTLEAYGLYGGINTSDHSLLDQHSIDEYNNKYYIQNNVFHVPPLYLPAEIYPIIHSNLAAALNRHKAMVTRLKKPPELAKLFQVKMAELLDRNIITKRGSLDKMWHVFDCEQQQYNENILLPIRLVLCKEKTTKLRLTLDCGVTNKILSSGKLLLNPVFNVFLLYRLAPFSATLDIKQMYYSLSYATDQAKNIFSFLSQDLANSSPIEVYRFEKGCMGARSTQFLAIQSMHKIANIAEKEGKPKVAQSIRNAYSDNINILADSPSECNVTLKDCITILEKYHFMCHEIFSDHKEILAGVPEEKVSAQTNRSLFSNSYIDENTKAPVIIPSRCLGMNLLSEKGETVLIFSHWCDIIKRNAGKILTKRRMAATVASCFDVLQIISPITCFGKAALNLLWSLDRDI